MERKTLYHGSPKNGLAEILPGKNKDSFHPNLIFASTSMAVAVLFTLTPSTVSFMIDFEKLRIYVPDVTEVNSRDRGGSIYEVDGDFRPALDRLIREHMAEQARVKKELPIVSATQFLMNLGYAIIGGQELFWRVERYLGENRTFPKNLQQFLVK